MTLTNGAFASGDIWLKQGGASWKGENHQHQLSVDNLTAHVTQDKGGWQFAIPDTRISMDNKPSAARRADAGVDAGTGRRRDKR